MSILIFALVACAPSDPLLVADYKTRLARSLDVDNSVVKPVISLAFPRDRLLQVPTVARSVNLLEFLALSDCELQTVIADKNSSLGRVATPAMQLINELRFLASGEQCIEKLRSAEPALAIKLSAVIDDKRTALPVLIWRATLAGDEFRAFWRNRSGSDPSVDAELIQALHGLNLQIAAWHTGDYRIDESIFLQRLRVIASGRGGDLLLAWQHLESVLNDASRIAETRLQKSPLCRPDYESRSAEIFRRVVTQYFIAGVQKKAAGLNRATIDLEGELLNLEASFAEIETGAYREWRRARANLVAEGRSAIKHHADALAPLMRQCGYLPEG